MGDDDLANQNVYDDDGYDDSICRVYDKNDFFTILVQLMLGFVAVLSLYIKRMQETPRRTFGTWFLDVSKQGFGACYAHVLNMIIAAIISKNIRGDTVLEDQCAWYGLSYLIDTTLGLILAIIGVRLLDNIANERDWTHLKHSGVYTGPGGWVSWISQVVAWLFILSVVKIIIYFFMWAFSEPLAVFGGFLFNPFQANKHFELVFVMILFPGVLNCIYFWIADSYLQAKKDAPGGAHEPGEDESGKTDSLLTEMAETEVIKNKYIPAPWSSIAVGTNAVSAEVATHQDMNPQTKVI